MEKERFIPSPEEQEKESEYENQVFHINQKAKNRLR